MDTATFIVLATFVFVMVSVLLSAMTYFSATGQTKYKCGWNGLVSWSVVMSILLGVQSYLSPICCFRAWPWLLFTAAYLPYVLWVFSLVFLRRAAQAMKKDDFHNTHFQLVYSHLAIMLAVLLPLLNVSKTIMQHINK